jgi:hypothetical protein
VKTIAFRALCGRGNKQGISLRRLLIFGPAGLSGVRGWIREWLKR